MPKDKLIQEARDFGIDKYFQEISGSIHDKSLELKELIQRNNLNIKETAFVSHMLGDIKIAKSAGLTTVAPDYGNYVSPEEIKNNKPDMIISDIRELLQTTNKEAPFAIIWDQTGVLFKNGRKYVKASFEKVFQRNNVNISEEWFNQKYRGNSLKTQIAMWEDQKSFLEKQVPYHYHC